LAGNATGAQEQKVPAAPGPVASEDYVIGSQDVLSVVVWREPDLSVREMGIRPDGRISLPLINEIQAAGLTTRQLREQITERLKDFVAAPTVWVMVLKSLSQKVSIVGEVGKSGSYPLGTRLTVLELLAQAGGITELAKSKDIKVVRNEGGRNVQLPFNYKEAIRGKNLQQNILLKDGDIVLVP
jgi:polysaccharide export outer membrane protein